jgi:hypothetical protein
MQDKRQDKDTRVSKTTENGSRISDFVLDKFIFSNVFEKDIRRIYIYRKSERLAKALQLIAPAFVAAPSLRNRLDGIAVGLIDAAILPPTSAREALSRELLALSSILSVARTGGFLSGMNADLITREAHLLLQEIASYEEPRLFMEEVQTLAELAKQAPDVRDLQRDNEYAFSQPDVSNLERSTKTNRSESENSNKGQSKRQIKDTEKNDESVSGNTERQEAILGILKTKGPSYIKDVSTLIREVSEKTIQRELQLLVTKGLIQKEGDRRWTRYSIEGQS